MSKSLVKTLQGVPTNGNLPVFNAIRLEVKDNGSTLQNINIFSTDDVEYDIVNNAFSFANRDGSTRSEYTVTIPAGRSLYQQEYEIPASAVGEILVKNVFDVTTISANRGNFEIDVEDLYDLNSLTTISDFAGSVRLHINGDITHFIANKQLTEFTLSNNSSMVGTFKEVLHPESFITIKSFNTGLSGDITDFAKFSNLATLWLTNDAFEGTIEDLVAGLVANGRTSGTINLAVNGTQVTFYGRRTNKGANLVWDGVNNITYDAF